MRGLFSALTVLFVLGCHSGNEQPTTIFGQWRAIAIHLPEPYTSMGGDNRLDIHEYGSARLWLKEDSAYESNINLTKDLKVKRPVGPTEVTTSLWTGKLTSQRWGSYRDSAGYLVLTGQDFVSLSRHELRNGVLVTTSTVKGHTFQIIWERED
jgi:hypothetical protein